jgi:hypothetical protein
MSWPYSAIASHARPRRVEDSPTKHRPQECVGQFVLELLDGGSGLTARRGYPDAGVLVVGLGVAYAKLLDRQKRYCDTLVC